jgi:uroporphyrinogen decarboxylase
VGFDTIHTTANPEYVNFKLHKRYGNEPTFIGNLSPQDLADKEPDFIKLYSKKLIKTLGTGRGYIFNSGHSINPSVKLENFLAIVRTREEEIYPL